VKSKLSVESGVENFMKVVEGRNVTQMASLMQNLVESQLFGDGVTETSGDINLDSDIKEALKSIKQLLLGDIQTALKKEHHLDQLSVDNLKHCWTDCNTAEHEDQQQVDSFWTLMQGSKTQHEACRKDVHAKYIDKIKKCNALDIWIDGLQCPVCYKEECVTIHDPSNHKVGDMLQAHISWAKNSYAEWTGKHGACAQAVRDYDKADKDCDLIQGDYESSVCAHRQAKWTTCDVNQMTCCARCSAQFDLEVSRVECAEHDRKIDWSATKKIECYIDVLMASPTDDELAAKCNKDGKACINQWREHEYKKCSDVCSDIDFDAGDYKVVSGVNTTHRLNVHQSGDRCTLHLDINFPSMHPCVTCPPPPAGPCEDAWIISTYSEYDVITCVPGLEEDKECHPDQHQQWWAYSRAECRACPPLIGRPGTGYPSLPGAAAHAGHYDVYYRGGKRSTGANFHCDGRIEQPGIFSEMPHTSNVAQKCSQPRDSKATMYVMNTHGAGKYECLWSEGGNIVGSHYTGPNAFWGTIEYRVKALAMCVMEDEE